MGRGTLHMASTVPMASTEWYCNRYFKRLPVACSTSMCNINRLDDSEMPFSLPGLRLLPNPNMAICSRYEI